MPNIWAQAGAASAAPAVTIESAIASRRRLLVAINLAR